MSKKNIGVYCGSFNPLHVGHQNIIEKAERIFDEVIVSIGINPEKHSHIEDEELHNIINLKLNIIKKQLPSNKVEYYMGFLTEYVIEKQKELGDGYNIIVIRGLRNGYDFNYEYNQIRFMLDMYPSLNIISIFTDPMYAHVSSSAYKMLESIQSGAGNKYLAKQKEKK